MRCEALSAGSVGQVDLFTVRKAGTPTVGPVAFTCAVGFLICWSSKKHFCK